MRPTPSILHVDMDAFFASVEQRDDPSLRGRPVLVGGDGPRGVVAAASYEARKFGCRSAMPMAMAKRLCPHAAIVRGSHDTYSAVSKQVFAILGRYSPLVQPVSVDEAFVDLAGTEKLNGEPAGVAVRIRRDIFAETQLTASIGCAPNKFLAKLASDLDKPDGLTVIRPEEIDRILPPLDVGKIWGVGPKSLKRLHSFGIKTFGDVRRWPLDALKGAVGDDFGEHIHHLAFGRDDREVHLDRDTKSIGQEQTFGEDLQSAEEIRHVLLGQVEVVAARLRKYAFKAKTVTLKIRAGDYTTVTRATTLPAASDATADLWNAAKEVFDEWATRSFHPVRLIGVSLSHLDGDAEAGQLELFAGKSDKSRKLDAAVDLINGKFGGATVARGGPSRVRRRRYPSEKPPE